MADSRDNAKYFTTLIGNKSVNLMNSVEVWAVQGYHVQNVMRDISDLRQLIDRLERAVANG